MPLRCSKSIAAFVLKYLHRPPTAVLPAVLLLLIAAAGAQTPGDWPNWRGPHYDGISRESDWSDDWNDRPPQRVWQARVGTGFSSVSVSAGRLYTMGNSAGGEDGRRTDFVYCFNAATGELIWQHQYRCVLVDNLHAGGPGATPTVDGPRLYTIGREGQLHCLQTSDGKVIWSKDLVAELGVDMPDWGFTCSPLVLGDKLIVEAGRTAAYDKATGKRLWQTAAYRPGYGAPVAFQHNGRSLLAVLNNDALLIVAADDGAEIAKYPWKTSYVTTSTTPIVQGDEIFISSGYNQGCALLRLADDELQFVYENRTMRNHFNNSVLLDGKLYGMDGNSHSSRNVRLICMDWKTGKLHWSRRGFGCGSLVAADGKLIVLADDGRLHVAGAKPQDYDELGSVKALGGLCWTVPVLAHGRIYCRNAAGDVVCLALPKK